MSVPCNPYQRYLEPGFTPFDPLELARQTEDIVCRSDSRKYTKFYCTRVYRGIATGYTCGCCLRCIFCWVNWSRDFPEKYGTFRSPAEAFHQLSRVARKARILQLRVSGAEPTITAIEGLCLGCLLPYDGTRKGFDKRLVISVKFTPLERMPRPLG